MRKKQVIKVGIFGLAAIFLLSMASSSTDQDATAQGKGYFATICMTLSGDLDAVAGCYSQRIKSKTTQLIVRPFVSNLAYFATGDGAKCFDITAACFEDGISAEDNVTLAVVKENDGTAWARVYFWAYVNDGTTELLYGLHMYGSFSSDWPPKDGHTTLVILDTWEMVSEGKGKLRKVSCTGSGPPAGEPFLVTIEVTRDDIS